MSSRLIVICASHSGLQALCSLVDKLPEDFPAPIFVVQHTAKSLLEVEDRIAEGKLTAADWQMLSGASRLSALSCPECHGPLCELPEKNMLRFRCNSGHGYSAQSLASAKAGGADATRSTLHAALMEELALGERVLAEPAYRRDGEFAEELSRRVGRLMVEAHQIQKWSTAMLEGSGFEPPATAPSAVGSVGGLK